MESTPANPARRALAALRDWLEDHRCHHRWHAHRPGLAFNNEEPDDGTVWRCCACGSERARPPAATALCVCERGEPATGTIRPGRLPRRRRTRRAADLTPVP